MWPIIFQLGPITIYSYGVSLAIAILVCGWLIRKDAKRKGIASAVIYDLMFNLVLWGILGARIFYIFLSLDHYQHNVLEIFLFNKGGLAWQGGFIGAVIAGILFARKRKIALALLFDLAAPYIALGQAIGRLGCFANGCCYGKPVSWGLYFPAFAKPLHPTQLYEAGSLFLIYIILIILSRKKLRPGMIFVGYLWLAALERFVIEFYRADQMAFVGPLSLFQWIAVGVFGAGIYIFLFNLKRR